MRKVFATTGTTVALALGMAASLPALAAAQDAAPKPSPASPQPAGSSAPQASTDKPASGVENKTSASSSDASKTDESKITEQSGYPLKSGGTYQPPAERRSSPAQDFNVYGRT